MSIGYHMLRRGETVCSLGQDLHIPRDQSIKRIIELVPPEQVQMKITEKKMVDSPLIRQKMGEI